MHFIQQISMGLFISYSFAAAVSHLRRNSDLESGSSDTWHRPKSMQMLLKVRIYGTFAWLINRTSLQSSSRNVRVESSEVNVQGFSYLLRIAGRGTKLGSHCTLFRCGGAYSGGGKASWGLGSTDGLGGKATGLLFTVCLQGNHSRP
jgi:hypothetical protein